MLDTAESDVLTLLVSLYPWIGDSKTHSGVFVTSSLDWMGFVHLNPTLNEPFAKPSTFAVSRVGP